MRFLELTGGCVVVLICVCGIVYLMNNVTLKSRKRR
jgi:hypothetical protein